MALSTPAITLHIPMQLSMVTAPFLWADLKEKMKPKACIVLDMTKTKSIDDKGIQILKQAFNRAKHLNARLKIKGLNASIKSRINASGLLESEFTLSV